MSDLIPEQKIKAIQNNAHIFLYNLYGGVFLETACEVLAKKSPILTLISLSGSILFLQLTKYTKERNLRSHRNETRNSCPPKFFAAATGMVLGELSIKMINLLMHPIMQIAGDDIRQNAPFANMLLFTFMSVLAFTLINLDGNNKDHSKTISTP